MYGEIWLPHPNFPGYEFSNFGDVLYKGRPKYVRRMSQGNGNFYVSFEIEIAGKRKIIRVHHIVAELFIGPRPPSMVVMHLDDNRNNNVWTNLAYGTQSDNEIIKRDIRLARFGFY
jgi:hypothetical protein